MFTNFAAGRRPRLMIILCIIFLTFVSFSPVLRNGFVFWDDNVYVTDNPQVQAGITWSGLRWALTTTHGANWHPLTWLSHMLDAEIFGLNPTGHHLTNLLFHIANSVLLFITLEQIAGAPWRSAVVALLFAVHPMHAESVAWIAERKDVLSTLLWILTVGAYARYVRNPRRESYLLVVGGFALGLMAKPMLVTLPFTLLLLDHWPLRRLKLAAPKPGKPAPGIHWAVVMEKLPLLALSAVSSIITVFAQRSLGAVQTLEDFPLWVRLGNGISSYVTYIQKMVWPRNLAAFYPHPEKGVSPMQAIVALAALAAFTAYCVRERQQRPYLVTGWFWYLGTLVPTIGIVQVGGQAMADRYSYVPLIGLFVILAWGLPELLSGWNHGTGLLAPTAFIVLLGLSACTWVQVGYWRDTRTLFEHAIRAVPNNYVAHEKLGYVLAQQGKIDEAIAEYRQVLRIRPRSAVAHNNLAVALSKRGETDEAMAHYSAALQIRPGKPEAHVNVGVELAAHGKPNEAASQFAQALRFDPGNAQAHYNLALVLAAQGRPEQAIPHYLAALRSQPNYAEAHMNLGVALAQTGRLDDAISRYAQALQLKPDYADAHVNWGVELAGQGKVKEALQHFVEATRLSPDSAEAHFNLGKAYLYLQNRNAASEQYQLLARLNPSAAAELRKMMGN